MESTDQDRPLPSSPSSSSEWSSSSDGESLVSEPSRIPSLPVEILSMIIGFSDEQDWPFLMRTSRAFAELTRPVALETLEIRGERGLERLLHVVEMEERASLVRTLYVCPGTRPEPFGYRRYLAHIATSLSLLPNVSTFDFVAHPQGEIYLTEALSLAIQTHPSLLTFHYDNWTDRWNFLQPIGIRTRQDPLRLPFLNLWHGITLSDLRPFLDHMDARIETLQFGGRPERDESTWDFIPPDLMSIPEEVLPSLKQLQILFHRVHLPFASFLAGDSNWFKRTLAAFPALEVIQLESVSSEDLFFPINVLDQVAGSRGTAVASEKITRWWEATPLRRLTIDFKSKDGLEKDVVGLTISTLDYGSPAAEVTALVLKDLARRFPLLEKLALDGRWSSTMNLTSPRFLKALSSFRNLTTLTLPINTYLEPPRSLCRRCVDNITRDLYRWSEPPRWRESRRHEKVEPPTHFLNSLDDPDVRQNFLERIAWSDPMDSEPTFLESLEEKWLPTLGRLPRLRDVELFWEDPFGSRGWRFERGVGDGGATTPTIRIVWSDLERERDCPNHYLDGRRLPTLQYLMRLPGLFETKADFTPAFTLDRFFPRRSA